MNELQKWFTFRPWQRHSLVLMVGGLVYICVGIAFMSVNQLSDRRLETLVIALRMLPMESWALLFILSGLLACLSSRWPSFSDSWGYMVLCGLSSGWGAMYIFGWALGLAPAVNIAYGLVWALMAFLWWAISGLINPDKVLEVVVADASSPD